MMAGAAEFFENLYELAKPAWVDKSEYFLAVMEYQAYLAMEPNDGHFLAWPPVSGAALYRMQARSPKEMLRRNVVFEARSLTIL
jgi:hypothetical protein